MRILQIHNQYQQRGGEDVVVDREAALLRADGHEVMQLLRHNDEVRGRASWRLALDAVWSRDSHAAVLARIAQARPEIVHVHNTMPLLSPSVIHAARQAGVPVVMTLHNYRLVCPNGLMLREGAPCEACVGQVPWRAAWHRCYRGSAAQSGVVAVTLQLHRALGTWHRGVTRFAAVSGPVREAMRRGGLPADRIEVLPNFAETATEPPSDAPRHGLLYVGRLAAEKGVDLLVTLAAQNAPGTITVVGDGPLRAALEAVPGLRCLGPLPPAEVRREMRRARALLVPSRCAEPFGLTVIEAFSEGLPALVSAQGALPELVQAGRTGWVLPADDPQAWQAVLQSVLQSPEEARRRGDAAREDFLARWSPARHREALLAFYGRARASGRD